MADHQTNLWESCCLGKLQMARELLLAGADPNTKAGCDNWTCLMQAIWRNHEEVVDLLLAQPNIDVNSKDIFYYTALHYACSRFTKYNVAILSKLLAVPGILLNERDSNRGTQRPKRLKTQKKLTGSKIGAICHWKCPNRE